MVVHLCIGYGLILLVLKKEFYKQLKKNKNFFRKMKNGQKKNVQNRKSQKSFSEKKLKKLFRAFCRENKKTIKIFCDHDFFLFKKMDLGTFFCYPYIG